MQIRFGGSAWVRTAAAWWSGRNGRVKLQRRLQREGVIKLAAELPGCVDQPLSSGPDGILVDYRREMLGFSSPGSALAFAVSPQSGMAVAVRLACSTVFASTL